MYPANSHPLGSHVRKRPTSGASKVQHLLLVATALALHLLLDHVATADTDTDLCADSQSLASALLSKGVQHVRIAGEPLCPHTLLAHTEATCLWCHAVVTSHLHRSSVDAAWCLLEDTRWFRYLLSSRPSLPPLAPCQVGAHDCAAGTVRVDPRHFRSAAAVTSGRHLRITSAGAAPEPSLI
jgi:hypothetical protein